MGSEPAGSARSRAAERGLAHDLRNLLTVIDGHAQLARASLAPDHPARDDVNEVLAATGRAHQLTESMLLGPGAATPPIVPAPLDDLVRGFLPLVAAIIGPDVTVEVRLQAPALVRISRLRLERVLLNLCLNARDAMAGGGQLAITATGRADGQVEVAVSDTGPGIDPAIVARLFDAEAPVPNGSDRHGLGLVTSLSLLDEVGGVLEIEARPGAGTTIRAVLPRA